MTTCSVGYDAFRSRKTAVLAPNLNTQGLRARWVNSPTGADEGQPLTLRLAHAS